MKKVAVAIHAIPDFDINIIKDLKNLDYIHVDVMDGNFVNNTMLNLDIFKHLKKHFNIPIIAHMMVRNPLDYIGKIIKNIDGFFFHLESEGDPISIINNLKAYNKKIGIVLNPPSTVSKIVPFLNHLDFVLIMGVNPGWSGQQFIPETIEKVKELAGYKRQHRFEIDVDGGVNLENAPKLEHADILSSSSTILKAKNPNKAINRLKNS